MNKRPLLMISTLVWILLSILSCEEGDKLAKRCEGGQGDCDCEADSDCALTRYHLNVTEKQDCSTLDAECCTCLFPLNQTAERRNEANYLAVCGEEWSYDCDTCTGPFFTCYAACKNDTCVAMKHFKE